MKYFILKRYNDQLCQCCLNLEDNIKLNHLLSAVLWEYSTWLKAPIRQKRNVLLVLEITNSHSPLLCNGKVIINFIWTLRWFMTFTWTFYLTHAKTIQFAFSDEYLLIKLAVTAFLLPAFTFTWWPFSSRW